MDHSLSPLPSTVVAVELQSLLKVSAAVAAAMSLARLASTTILPGRRRLLSLLPIITLLPFLSLSFTTIHLRGISAIFLAWLSVLKLLLLAFGLGPLSPCLPLPTFIAVASLPLNLRPTTTTKPPQCLRLLPTAGKALIFAALIPLYRCNIPQYPLFSLYVVHLYLALDLVLTAASFPAAAVLGLDLDPHFNAPYRAASLAEFWGRRWNLMVTSLLRDAVFLPVRAWWGPAAGILATFVVSGVAHELIFYYLILARPTRPTGEMTGFFVVHGVCIVVEALARWWARRSGWRPVASVVAVPLTLGFVAVTGFWLLFLPMVRSGADKRMLQETSAVLGFVMSCGRKVVGSAAGMVVG